MTRTAMLNLAIKCVAVVQQEKYGWSAKMHEEDMKKWNQHQETIDFLKGLKHEQR